MINAPQIIFMADSHNQPTSTEALIEALSFLISKGFDTLCFEEPSEPKISMKKRIQIADFDYKLKKAIEDKNMKYIEFIEKEYGRDIVEAEKNIATHSSTHLARKNLLEKVNELGIKFVPIDVNEPTKVETNLRNQHMLREVKSAISASNTKKIIVFAGYGHIGNHFGGGLQHSTVYNRGLTSLLNYNASFYFAFFSDEDSERIKKYQEYAPLININPIRFVKILNNNYATFINQLKLDIEQPTFANPSAPNLQTYYTTLYNDLHDCEIMNEGTILYIKDLGGKILPMQYKFTPQVTAQSFEIDSALLTKPARDKLNIDRVFILDTYGNCLDIIRKEIPICTIEKAQNKEGKDGYYLTFIKTDTARSIIRRIIEDDKKMKKRETTSINALIEMNKSSLATHRNVNTSAHTTANLDTSNKINPKYI